MFNAVDLMINAFGEWGVSAQRKKNRLIVILAQQSLPDVSSIFYDNKRKSTKASKGKLTRTRFVFPVSLKSIRLPHAE